MQKRAVLLGRLSFVHTVYPIFKVHFSDFFSNIFFLSKAAYAWGRNSSVRYRVISYIWGPLKFSIFGESGGTSRPMPPATFFATLLPNASVRSLRSRDLATIDCQYHTASFVRNICLADAFLCLLLPNDIRVLFPEKAHFLRLAFSLFSLYHPLFYRPTSGR